MSAIIVIGRNEFGDVLHDLDWKRKQDQAREERLLKKGLKIFHVGGFRILALNQKNADRKAKNLK